MSTAVFPSLAGLGYPVIRTSLWDSNVQASISGKENRLANWTFPKYQWKADINALRSIASPEDFQTLIGFVNARQGSFDSFLYQDPDDNAVTGQDIAIGNGALNSFQMVRAFGGFVEPVLAPNVVSNVYYNGVSVPPTTLSAPSACSLSYTPGGSLAATTYYVRAVWTTVTGQTLAGTESSLAVPANNVLVVAAPASPPSGAVVWIPYVSNTAMGGSGAEQYQNSGGIGLATAWTEPTSGLVSGGAMPAANTTGWGVTTWGSGNVNGPGVLVFNNGIPSGVVISADFTYYWPCRFLADKTEFSLNFQGLYSVKSLSWQTVKN